MTLTQALSIANLLIEFELETPQVQPPPEAWEQELREARQAINQAMVRPNRGEFFLSAPARKKAGRESNWR